MFSKYIARCSSRLFKKSTPKTIVKCSRYSKYYSADHNHNYSASTFFRCNNNQICRYFSDDKQLNLDNPAVGKVSYLLEQWKKKFEDEGVTEPAESIKNIMAHVLSTDKVSDLSFMKDRILSDEQLDKLEHLCFCRLTRMPVQYIIGEWDFRDIKLKLEPPIFIPRPETEQLVDLVLEKILNESTKSTKSIMEIGCGSGAISLAILHSSKNNNINIVAIDANPRACKLTRKNAQSLSLLDDRFEVINASLEKDGTIMNKTNDEVGYLNEAKFDLIVSNPPYIPTSTLFELQPEVILYEDVKALDGGEDGLEFLIKPIIAYASKALNSGGFLLMEVDSEHPDKIKSFLEDCDELEFVKTIKDFNSKDRFVEIKKRM